MALDDTKHVEAVAIIRGLIEPESREHMFKYTLAAYQWLKENQPSPEVYIAAVQSLERIDPDA